MNLQQAKQLFFAQYLEQRVAIQKSFGYAQILNSRFLDGGIDNSHLLLRTVNQLTDREAVQIARFAHQMPDTNFEVKRCDDLIHVQHTDNYGITSHISLYKNYGSVNANVHFNKTEKEAFSTYKANIGEINRSARLPVPYIAICDYMRSIGILLPFTYLSEENKPVTLQPDEIISLGWAKIKEEIR